MTRKKKRQRKQPPETVPSTQTSAKSMTNEGQFSQSLPQEFPNQPSDELSAQVETVSFRGPLPHPNLFERYEEILPGAAERILTLTETEQSHRQQWENSALNGQNNDSRRAHWMGFGLGMTGLSVAFLCAYLGLSNIVAASSIFLVIAGIGTTLVGRRPSSGSDN